MDRERKPRPTHFRPEPRGLTAEQAAYYCGVSVPTFLIDWAPLLSPRLVGRDKTRRVWDRRNIDYVWDRLSGISVPESNDPAADSSDGRALAASYALMEERERDAQRRRGRNKG
jgi:hypothetical protein